METEGAITEQGTDEIQGKEAPQQEITCSTATHLLDLITARIHAAEHQLIQQRVDAAIHTAELATLHEPRMRELLAQCAQGYSKLLKKYEEYQRHLDQFSEEIKSVLPQSGNPVHSSATPSDDPSMSLME